MPRPDCPRCGSVLVVPASSGVPSEWVLELRGGGVPVRAVGGAVTGWFCRSCGHQWDPDAYPERWVPAAGDPLPDPSDLLRDLGDPPEPPEGSEATDEPREDTATALRRAREERGQTLSEASRATGIWGHYLQALESDAPLEDFLAPAYARFFLREYAEFLGLDPALLVREFDARHPTYEEPPFEPLPDPRGRRKVVATVLAVLSAAALIGIAFLSHASGPRAEPISPASVSAAGVGHSGHAPVRRPVPPEPRGMRAVLWLSQPSWVQAVADGKVLASTTLQPGTPVVYRARHLLRLVLGNAGGVDLRVNGEPVATGNYGEVVRLDFRWRKGRLLAKTG